MIERTDGFMRLRYCFFDIFDFNAYLKTNTLQKLTIV